MSVPKLYPFRQLRYGFFIHTPPKSEANAATKNDNQRSPKSDEEKQQRSEQSGNSECNAPKIGLKFLHVSSLLTASVATCAL